MDKSPETEESVWAAFRETDRRQKETDRRQKETDRQLKAAAADFDRRMREWDVNFEKSKADFDRQMAESKADFDRRMAESKADSDRRTKEWDENFEKSKADYDRRMKDMNKTIGAWSNNHGEFAEEYFFNSFENGNRYFFGEKFDRIEKNVHGGDLTEFKDEYDILLINGKSIAIIEIKFKAHYDHIPKIIKKAQTFRDNFPTFASHRIYLALASLTFTPDVEADVKKSGIAVIKQVADRVEIYSDDIKIF